MQELWNQDLDITEEGTLYDFLGINIRKHEDGKIEYMKLHIITQIMELLQITDKTSKKRSTPAISTSILTRNDDDIPHDKSFHYRSVIEKLNYIDRGSLPDISYITHQCGSFSSSLNKNHASEIRWLARYLL